MTSYDQHIRVYIRIKPTDRFAVNNIKLFSDSKAIEIHSQDKEKPTGYINNQILDWHFKTDGILHNVSQEDVFSTCASHQVSLSLQGYNTTLFMYGQTGAGKTYTMTGTTNNFEQRGIIPRAISQLFSEISRQKEQETTVRISYLEIYKEQMFDLLSTMHGNSQCELSITEDTHHGTYVKDLNCLVAKNEEEALNMLFEGESNRIISHHQLNRLSSRSHCIFTIHIESHCTTESESRYIRSKLNLVDLAGSERLEKTLTTGAAQEEAMFINKSLTFLEQVIISLEQKNRHHVPYRQSKLTHVLKDSLGGKCSTVMIGNIWGEKKQLEETLSTLRFATRVMKVPSQPAVNSYQNPVKLCKKYEKEILHLRKELAMYDTLTNRSQINYEPLSDVQIQDIRHQVRKYLDNDSTDIEVVNLRQVQEIFRQFKHFVEHAEKETIQHFKEKHTINEKTENVEKAGEPSAPLVERIGLVGETDGNNFSVGRVPNGVKPAVNSALANSRKKNKKLSKESPDMERKNTPPTGSGVLQNTNSQQAHVKTTGEESSVCAITTTDVDNESPPMKDEAFEMFKGERGSALHKIFLENKEILTEKRHEAKTLSFLINDVKQEIDCIKSQLDDLNKSKDFEQETTATGEIVLDEDEYELLCKLRATKNKYREHYEQLQKARSDIVYCDSLVKQCRKKLLLDFETWYTDSFRFKKDPQDGENGDQAVSNNQSKVVFQSHEDNGEKFDRIQKQLLMNNPESVAFYNARIQTERRKLYGAQETTRPGSVIASIRNAPPKTMVVQK